MLITELKFGSIIEPFPLQNGVQVKIPPMKQVHSNRVVTVQTPHQSLGEADGMVYLGNNETWTDPMPLYLGIYTADCVPILGYRHTDFRAAAAIHAGWRGIDANILASFQNLLIEHQNRPEDWSIWLGPSIGPCCYEVNQELFERFNRSYGQPALSRHPPKINHLDLQWILRCQIAQLGFRLEFSSIFCTFCSTSINQNRPLFQSYRRLSGSSARQLSWVKFDPRMII